MGSRTISITYQTFVRDRPLARIRINAAAGNPRRGWLTAEGWTIPVALGRGGIKANKREGDGGTPRGVFHPRRLWWRADRHARPKTFLSVRPIRAEDAWCEDPAHGCYNRLVQAPPRAGMDRLTRNDHVYDLVVVIGHNDRPRVRGKGSAVFVHLARPGYTPTAGCIALDKRDLDMLLRSRRDAVIAIQR